MHTCGKPKAPDAEYCYKLWLAHGVTTVRGVPLFVGDPERCKALVAVSGYLIGSQALGKEPLPPKAELEQHLHQALIEARERLARRGVLLEGSEDA